MTRRCELTGKTVARGNNVSHSKQRTNRRFLPNLQNVTLISDILGRKVRLRITTSALKTIDAKGGLDAFLISANDDKLSVDALSIKKMIKKAQIVQ